MHRLEGYRVARPLMTPTTLGSEGWAMQRTPPGFRLVSCVRRPMQDPDSAELSKRASADPQVLQSIFSDGLTHVSLFIEPYDPARHVRPLATSVGATQTLMLRQGTWWITLLGDVPAATLQVFASGLERSR